MNIEIKEIKYIGVSTKQAVATIVCEEINGKEPFSYFVALDHDDDAPIHKYIKSKIKSGNVKVQSSDTDINEYYANEVREQRNALLQSTDKYMTIDYPISEENRNLLKEYRQALRDITIQSGFPQNVTWPEKPEI